MFTLFLMLYLHVFLGSAYSTGIWSFYATPVQPIIGFPTQNRKVLLFVDFHTD